MADSRLRVFRADRPSLDEEPKFFTQLPDDLDDDGKLNARPGPTGILRALLRLIRRSGSKDRSVVCTCAEIAAEATVSVRSVKTHIGRLAELHYIERETVPGPRGFAARKTRFRVVYNLRPGYMLEADPPTVTGSREVPRVKKSSPSRVKKSSPSRVKKSSPQLTMFERAPEQRNTTEEKHDDVSSSASVVVVSPAAPGESNPDPLVVVVDRIRGLWPEEPLIERRAAELASRGVLEALLAIEYAERKPGGKADGLAYAFNTRNRWFCSGYDLAECDEEVRGRRPNAPPPPAAPVQQESPPPTPEEIREFIAGLDSLEVPMVRRMAERQVHDWMDKGLVPDDLIPGAQKTGRGISRQLPPRPAGTIESVPSAPGCDPNHRMKGCTRQEPGENGDQGLLPSDSSFGPEKEHSHAS
jgi:hypothetical protein